MFRLVHVRPASLVFKIVPEFPTINPAVWLMKNIPFKGCMVPEVIRDHSFPPLTVLRMVPLDPTANPVLASMNLMELIVSVTPEV